MIEAARLARARRATATSASVTGTLAVVVAAALARPADGQTPATGLNVPAWDWAPPFTELCLQVPDTRGVNGTWWRNNSRGLFVAVPEGDAPAGGWPVLLDLSILDYPTKHKCGLDGRMPPHDPNGGRGLPDACTRAASSGPCNETIRAGGGTSFSACEACVWTHWRDFNQAGCANESLPYVVGPDRPGYPTPLCPPLPPLSPACGEALNESCPIRLQGSYTDCLECVERYERNVPPSSDPCRSQPGVPSSATRYKFCDGVPPGAGHEIIEDFSPFASPHEMGMACSCLNGTGAFDCPDGGFMGTPRGAGCTVDTFAGGIWWQRTKQYAVANGIAVVVANTYYLDGWESYPDAYNGGFDPPFFAALEEAMGNPASPPALRALNPRQIAVHGWSGGAQEVSWAFQLHGSGQLGGMRIVAGIMSAGGSYACYNNPPLARGVCANCNVTESHERVLGCSNVTKASGVEPLCSYCCPDNYTEQHYEDHPDDYATHPWSFLFQTHTDSDADSCAAAYYHDTMVAHGAHSELMYVPVGHERCFSIGEPGDPAVPKADSFARFCSSPNVTSMNHTSGFAGMVEPCTRFLVNAFAHHAGN